MREKELMKEQDSANERLANSMTSHAIQIFGGDVLRCRLTDFVESSNLHNRAQLGFQEREDHSCLRSLFSEIKLYRQ